MQDSLDIKIRNTLYNFLEKKNKLAIKDKNLFLYIKEQEEKIHGSKKYFNISTLFENEGTTLKKVHCSETFNIAIKHIIDKQLFLYTLEYLQGNNKHEKIHLFDRIIYNIESKTKNAEKDIEYLLTVILDLPTGLAILLYNSDSIEKGRQVKVPLPEKIGIIDIIYRNLLIELKTYDRWGEGIQQLTEYGEFYPDRKKVLLLFNKYTDDINVQRICEQIGIKFLIFEDLITSFANCSNLKEQTERFLLE